MLQIIILYSFIMPIYLQQEKSYILPKENQFFKDVISNFDEQIQQTQMLGFGLWFKWQPKVLQAISKTENECLQQFIFSFVNFEKKFINIVYLKIQNNEYQLKILSDFFIFNEEIWFHDQFEGVWIFFDSVFDFNKKITTFSLFKSLTKELNQYKIDQIPIIQDYIQYQIGKICDQCVIQNFVNCFTRFEGRISILFQRDNFDESQYLTTIENKYSLVNDCIERNQKLIIGSQIYDENFYFAKNLGILEKLYFKLSGWVNAFNYFSDWEFYQLNLFKIYKNYKEYYQNQDIAISIIYFASKFQNLNEILILTVGYQQKEQIQYSRINFHLSMMTQWHYFQLAVGYSNQTATFKIYTNQLNEIITFNFLFSLYTGISYGIEIRNDLNTYSQQISTIADFEIQTFCQPLDQEFYIRCHQICQTCFGPFDDNCLSCKSGLRRFLFNGQCLCDTGTFQFQDYEICQTIDDVFKNLMIIEEELPCKLEGYDECDDVVICSFGYFKHQEKYCIQCPYYNLMSSDSNILCVNCLIDPDQFSITLTCITDSIQLNQGESSTFDIVQRDQDNRECFEIKQLKNKQFSLQLLENKISNNPSLCRKAYFQENEKCFLCGYGCIECMSSIICSKCEEGYYLDKNNICTKCQNCLKCELIKESLNCLQCPEKYYLKNQQCLECGLYCADCRSNGYCNYCIHSQKYFISLDGINCLICNIPNCKYCYQEYQIDNQQILYSSHTLYLEYYTNKYKQREQKIQCSICSEGYTLDLKTNNCIKQFDQDNVCISGIYDESIQQFQCQSIIVQSIQCSIQIRNCKRCSFNYCLECQLGYYVDFLSMSCSKCPIQCENCIFQNQKLMDNWKIETQVRYDKILFNQFEIFSKMYDDYEIQCLSCPPNYILDNSKCIKGCNDECLKCEVFDGQAKCVECKPFNNGIVRSIDSNGQCLRCQQNCQQCAEKSLQNVQQINKFFIENQENQVYTRSCYKPLPSMKGKKNFINQLSVVDCEKFNKCKRKGIFTWNIYCDIQQFQDIQNKSGFFQEGHYYFQDFFGNDILSEIKILNLLINEYVIEQIDFILKIFQGNVNSCKPQEQTEILIKIHNKFIYNIFFFKGVNLKVLGQQQYVLLEDFIFEISGFQQIQFENLNFTRNKINISDTLTNSITFINCSFGNDSSISTLNPYNLKLIDVIIQITNTIQDCFFLFHFRNDIFNQQDIQIIINNLKIINSKFQNTKFISIITEIDPRANCFLNINNLEILETEFENSSFVASSGLKNIFFGHFFLSNLKIEAVNFKNSILLYLPNVLSSNFNFLTIKNLTLLSNSYFILSNQFSCYFCYLNKVEIDKSNLFSNKVPLLYQTSFSDIISIYLHQIRIENVNYNQEQSLIQIIKYNNNKMNVYFQYLKIDQVGSTSFSRIILSQEISLILISCSYCWLYEIEITRKNGIPEISIIDSEQIIISNIFFTQNVEQTQYLIDGCQSKGQNSFQYFIYFGQYEKITISNLTIVDTINFNNPLIIFNGIEIKQRQIEEIIEIINSKFENNKLITSKSNSPTSIILIQTKQKCVINLINLTFQDNHLHMEVQDLITQSSSTLLIDAQFGMIFMDNCLFLQNIVTNSTDSTLYVKAQVAEIKNTQFIKNNILNFQILLDRIYFKTQEDRVNEQNLQQVIKILSNGGCGYLLTNQFSLKNCTVQESYSLNGGAFYVNTFGDAQILIENSTFIKTSSSLQSSATSYGGCFYIDAQVSKLTLLVKNSTFNQSYSRSKGGCFYIVPSNSFNFLYFEQIKVINSFSTTSQFFEFTLQNLNSIISNVTFKNIHIVSDKIEFYQFLSLLDNLSSEEAFTILNNDPIIKIKYGNVTMDNIYCQLEIKIFLALIDQGQIININQIHIQRGYIRTSPFLSINLKSGFQGELKMYNLKIQNLLEYQEMNHSEICQENSIKNTLQQFCITPIVQSKNLVLENNIEMIQQKTLCQNQNLLFQSVKLKFSLILISNINTNHQIIIQEMLLNEIVCRYCSQGLLSLTNIDEHKQNNIILNRIAIYKSQCGISGCLSIINKNSINYLNTNYLSKENRNLQEQNYEKLKFNLNSQVSLSNSKFIQNMANYGGAICVIDIDILIDQCLFYQNKANVGGAIYSFTSSYQNIKTNIFRSLLIDNQAKIANEIYLENQNLPQTEKLNVIINNNSTIQGSTVVEKPRSLAISINKEFIVLQKEIFLSTSTKVIEQAIIKPYTYIGFKEKIETLMFPSGQIIKDYYFFDISTSTNIPYNLSFRIIALNRLNQKEGQLDGSLCTLEHKKLKIFMLKFRQIILLLILLHQHKQQKIPSESSNPNSDVNENYGQLFYVVVMLKKAFRILMISKSIYNPSIKEKHLKIAHMINMAIQCNELHPSKVTLYQKN